MSIPHWIRRTVVCYSTPLAPAFAYWNTRFLQWFSPCLTANWSRLLEWGRGVAALCQAVDFRTVCGASYRLPNWSTHVVSSELLFRKQEINEWWHSCMHIPQDYMHQNCLHSHPLKLACPLLALFIGFLTINVNHLLCFFFFLVTMSFYRTAEK